ncbi:MAG: acyl-CoA dehydrogenase family protein [Bacteroidia bacterium]|nr:acyl-CoA dehydrogenase family protein [Bacteroidia bacterium]
MEAVLQKRLARGGEFLIKSTRAEDVFIPELWSEEQKNIYKMCMDFIATHVHPNIERIDAMEEGLMERLLDEAGAQGLLGITLPEEYNGFGLDFNTGMYATEALGTGHSFAVALAAHTGIGTLPILYFGNEEQKKKYLPKFATGEWKAAYCLTEPGSGSDALGAKTKAVLSEDKKYYILNGQKMWITNAGFADVFIVFAKVDGNKFTGFIVERDSPGLTLGAEEKKMGIKGSSTRQVFFADVKVPVENVLGEIGRGHLIAFNILNIGRIKLAAAALGGCKACCDGSVKYANERHQFQRPISSFGAIQHKLAEQAIRIWALESAVYRASNDIQETEHKYLAEGRSTNEALLAAAQEFAAECAILKVYGSEVLDYVVDEGVQVFGGYGFSAEYPMDRAYRDARINRIFEGTNEINRMLTVDYIFKKALKGELDLMGPAMAVQKELTSIAGFESNGNGEPLAAEKRVIANLKKAILMTAGKAAMKYMQKLADEQEILLNLADMIIYLYAVESMGLRLERLLTMRGTEACALQLDMFRTYLNDCCENIHLAGKNVVHAMSEGDEQRILLMGLKRFTKIEPFNTVAARRRIAAALIEANGYCF